MRCAAFLVGALVWTCCTLQAQSTYRIGAIPQVNLNLSPAQEWKVNLKVEARQLFAQGQFGVPLDAEFRSSLTDLSLGISRKLGLNSTLTLGYLARLTDGGTAHRVFEQYSAVRRYPALRLGHRLASDQTFIAGETLILRLRYRITIDRALNGLSVDPGEWYFKLSNEYLGAFQNSSEDLEIRLSPIFGFALTDNSKLECGIDYRLDHVFRPDARSSFWLIAGWFVAL